MASSLRAHKPANACCACYQHSVQLKLLNIARPTAAHHTLQQTAISATSRSTNTYIAAQTFKQKRIGVRQQHIAPFGGRPVTLQRAFGESNGSSKDPSLQDYVEVKIESVKVAQGPTSVVYLRVIGGDGGVVPVHIGQHESEALLREINKQRQARPLTHDLMKNMVVQLGYRVTKVRVTDIIANTYYARIHVARSAGDTDEVDIDARPSDAINLAVRFGAPVYVSKRIAEQAAPVPVEHYHTSTNESHAEIARSVRETLSNYEDPTIMYQLQKELAVKEERFEDAQQFQENIVHEMTHNRLLRLVVAMESALADGRYEEAAHLRDEYKKAVQQQQSTQAPADR